MPPSLAFPGGASLLPLPLLFLFGCGGSTTDWRSRPPIPGGTSFYCVVTATGSFCEKSLDACNTARRYVSQHSAAVRSTGLECKPGEDPWCFSYLSSARKPPASPDLQTVREPGATGWVYDCAATVETCQRNQERIISDRTGNGDPTTDVSPCERPGR